MRTSANSWPSSSSVIAFRRSHAIFSRRHFLTGRPVAGETFKDITWFTPAGTEMTEFDWQQGFARCLGVHLSGAAVHRTDNRGQPVRDENFTLLFNAHHDTMAFVLPPLPAARCWRVQLQTHSGRSGHAEHVAGGATRTVPARSIVLLMEVHAAMGRQAFSGNRAPAARTARHSGRHGASAPRGCPVR